MKELRIPANVLLKIQNYCYETYSEMKTKNIEKMIDATVITWDILYGLYSRYGLNEYGYFNVYSQNKELQAIQVMINGKRYGYTTFINILKETLIIMENSSYKTDEYTKSYMLNCEWGSLYNYKINYVRYKSNIDNQREELIQENPEHENLINTLYRVNIDIEGMIKYLEDNIGKKLKPKPVKTLYGRTIIDTNRVIDEETIYRCLYDALRINNRKIYYTVKNRVYSSLSNLSSLCKDFIYVDGLKMVEVDVVNCQPLLLSSLCNDTKLQRVCERGRFYESLMEATGIEDRNEVKLMCYRDLLFGNYKPNSILGKAFKEIFPVAHEFLLNYSDDFDETLAKNLQIKESEIFIPFAMSLVKDFPVITKHDALLVPYHKISTTKYKLSQKFQEYGINPRF